MSNAEERAVVAKLPLDAMDRKILKALQKDGRMPVVEISRQVNLSKTPCTERIKRLEKLGYITGYCAQLDPAKLGFNHVNFVQVTLENTTTETLNAFNAAIGRIPEVQACHMIAGGYDYLLKVQTRDMAHYRKVLGDTIGTLPGVGQTHTYPVMETVLDRQSLDPDLY